MVLEVPPEEVRARLRDGPAAPALLDIREPWEREQARIEPSLFIPMEEIPDRLAELPRDRPLVVYCHHGLRSYVVADYLERQGFSPVASLRGGIDAWAALVDPSVGRYG